MPAKILPPSRAVGLLAGVTIALIVVSVALLLWQMRKRDLERARLDTASLTHMFREQTERTFETADSALRGVQERMQTAYGNQLALDSPAVRLLLAARLSGAPHLTSLVLADAQGRIVNSSLGDTQPTTSVAAKPYFRALADGRLDGLYIDRPAAGARAGEWTLDLARPFSDTAGKFRGVVVVTMSIPQLDQVYSWLKLDYSRPLSLYLADGTLIASVPHRADQVGEKPPELATLRLDAANSQVRMVEHKSEDGARHVFAIAGVGRFPLLVSVTSDEGPVLAAWGERSVPIAGGALLVCLFIGMSALLLAGELAREQQLEVALRDAQDRYHHTVYSVMDAIIALDGEGNITLFNPAAERMFGIGAGQAIGLPLDRLVPMGSREAHRRHVEEFMRSDGTSRGMAPRLDLYGVRADGAEFPIEATISRTMVGGKPQLTAVLRDVTDRRRSEQEQREMNRELRALSSSLQKVREEERTRIASELHDELGQQLTGLKLELSWVGGRLKEGRAPTTAEVDGMRHHLDAAITSVRRIATELRPRVLDDLAFDGALAWLCREFGQRTGLAIDLDLPAATLVADRALATAIYRIVQESLTNVARHAGAKRVHVRLVEEGDGIRLSVTDDGRGFATAASAVAGIGVVGMRERATALGGLLDIHGNPGRGTTVSVLLPLPLTDVQDLQEESA